MQQKWQGLDLSETIVVRLDMVKKAILRATVLHMWSQDPWDHFRLSVRSKQCS